MISLFLPKSKNLSVGNVPIPGHDIKLPCLLLRKSLGPPLITGGCPDVKTPNYSMPSKTKTTVPSPQQALSGQGVLRIPGKYAIAEGCCRKIQNGPSMVLRFGTLNVGSLTGRSMKIAEMLERRRIAFRRPDGNRMVSVI
ncbi:hypothetical protein HELRODRAFT_176116 [Helobdella robusta]|uniref:Uncharacterized protein n=1 Tax=Helobdella robusta TaxID=6412 RepID=T1FA57_HELRO|nr:hypothetical protein HELRODRAFT_176116 [Helobdella robusta]ESO00258.1 hypothetical protein HELRODRAFT_176116 [Helobdella robusta]